jgi:hypothetical protein
MAIATSAFVIRPSLCALACAKDEKRSAIVVNREIIGVRRDGNSRRLQSMRANHLLGYTDEAGTRIWCVLGTGYIEPHHASDLWAQNGRRSASGSLDSSMRRRNWPIVQISRKDAGESPISGNTQRIWERVRYMSWRKPLEGGGSRRLQRYRHFGPSDEKRQARFLHNLRRCTRSRPQTAYCHPRETIE